LRFATVAVNDPVVPPLGIVNVAGTVTFALPLERVTSAAPAPAGLDKITEQFEDPGAKSVDGLHARDVG
jgi:hypothetical protein